MISAVILAITETGEEGGAGGVGDVDAGENALVTMVTEPVSRQTLALTGLGGVETVRVAGIVERGPGQTHPLGLNKPPAENIISPPEASVNSANFAEDKLSTNVLLKLKTVI